MKILRFALYCCAVLALSGAVSVAPVRVPQAQIDAENARWQSYGVTLPKGGLVLEQPYAAPYTNRSFIVPFAWYETFNKAVRANHDYPVRASDLRADLPTLRLLMEKAYAGYPTAAKRGWKWNAWFKAWDARLAREGDARLPLAKAFAPWGDLERFQFDGHSGIPGVPLFSSGSSSAVLAAAPGGTCTALRLSGGRTRALAANDAGQQPHAVQAWDGKKLSPAWYVSYPALIGTPTAIRCGGRDVAVTVVPASGNLPSAPSYEPLGDGIAYLRMPSFLEAGDEAIRKAISQANGLGKEQVVLLDLRGNGGGSAPLDLLTTWFAGGAVEDAATPPARVGTTSCFVTALQFNLSQQLLASVRPPVSAGLRQRIQEIVDTAGKTPPDACAVKPDVQQAQSAPQPHRFAVRRSGSDQTRIIAIVDDKCASDCEYMAVTLSHLPDTVIVGASTYGVMGFTQPGYFVLPHTRVPFRLAASRTDAYGDGRSVDGYGLSVDVLLPTAASQQRDSLLALAHALAQ